MNKGTVLIFSILPLFFFLAAALAQGAGPQDNPFFAPYNTPFDTPPFERIKNAHFLPAVEEGIKREQAEVDALLANAAEPTFENTLVALDKTGKFLSRVTAVFFSLQSSNTSPELQKIAEQVSPLLSAHRDNIALNPKLFARVKKIYEQRAGLKLNPVQLYMLENSYKDFVRSGAMLEEARKTRLREINKQVSLLSLQFGNNLLAETNDFKLILERKEDLAGLPPSVVDMGAATAKQVGMAGKWVYTLQVPSWTPFLQYSERRELREKIHTAYCMRGDRNNDKDNKEIIRKILALKLERAKLLGYATPADFILEENMAKNPGAVNSFLEKLWAPALGRAKSERDEMQSIIDREKGGFRLEHWDWWYYAEKLRKEKYALEDSAIRPYFKLDNVKQGIFLLCEKLYGIKFLERKDLPIYHPEVQTYEVQEADGRHIGVLYMDFFPRASKRGGAWSGGFRRQYYENGKRVAPISNIVCNFTRPTADAPSLLSTDEVETFFHEFGHSLNTLFSDTAYETRNIPRDSVELPSQIMENWALHPELLKLYARHYKTGEIIPKELIDKIDKSRLFNQGFATVEYLAASILDMQWHTLKDPAAVDVNRFESEAMSRIGLIREIVPRYRTTYFNHIFSSGYSAGYYSYIWAEVLDADAFEAFKEKGLFDKATAASFRKNVLSVNGTEDAMLLYKRFRGAEPKIEPLLKRRGLLAE